jgi:hypothetical protein
VSDTTLLGGLAEPLRALAALTVSSPHLPAPCVSVTPIDPDRLELSFHPDEFGPSPMAAFEAWRAALGAAPDTVEGRFQSGGRTWVLSVLVAYAGATVRLVAFTSVDVPAAAGGSS